MSISGADPGLVLLCKWRSRISFLWNVKQAKKRLRSGCLMQSKSFCIFPCELWYAKFPRDFYREALVLKHVVWGWLPKCESFPGWIHYFEASNLRTFAKVFLEKVSLPVSLITKGCDSLTLIFFNIWPAINCTAIYFAHCMNFKGEVESEKFCQRDGTRIVSGKNSLDRKQGW